jgi:hypothetical protein
MNDCKLLELENQTFHSTIQKLRDYANLKDDWYINSKLDLLEVEIRIACNNAKIEVYNEINKQKK